MDDQFRYLYINALAVTAKTVFAGTGRGIFRSNDEGISWIRSNSGMTIPSAPGVEEPLDVCALTVLDTAILAGTDGGGVYRSTDLGASWTMANRGLNCTVIQALTVFGDVLYVANHQQPLGSFVYRSADRAVNWSEVATFWDFTVSALAMTGTLFLAGGDSGVFRSTDHGNTWAKANLGLLNTDVADLLVLGADVFVATKGGGVFHSSDSAARWTQVNNGLTNTCVYCLVAAGSEIFAGTNDGVFRTQDHGGHWARVANLTRNVIRALAVSDTHLFAGGEHGVWTLAL